VLSLVQRGHIPKAIMSVLEKDDYEDVLAVEKAKRDEEDRLAQQEKLYEVRALCRLNSTNVYV